MDNLTHSLIGALLGQAGLKKKTGLAMPALIIGANLPDVDAACFFWLEGSEHLGFRRGITHGPPAIILLPLILAGLLWGFDRWQTKRGKRPDKRLPVSFKWLYILSFIGCLSHPIFDWFNVYGVRLLEPFSSRWFYGDTLFIIDVWLWALLGVATWFSLRREKRGGEWIRPARVAIAISLAYIGLNGAITNGAVKTEVMGSLPKPKIIASPVPIWFWKREIISGKGGRYTIVDPNISSLLANKQTEIDDFEFFMTQVGDCALGPIIEGTKGNSSAEAFFFWSRTPFAERAPDGSVILLDARFTDPRVSERFGLPIPDVKCVELNRE